MTIQVGDFELLTPLADGGMGRVWQAEHRASGTPAAVKVVRGTRTVFHAAFRREVRAVAALDHPAIVQVYDLGEVRPYEADAAAGALEAGSAWLAMALADGSLATQPPGDWAEVRAATLDVLDGLGWAHGHGVIHRDLKPGNVLRGADGGFVLADFGIAHQVGRSELGRAEVAEGVWGTPDYMAPEQLQGRFRDMGPWTDLYALGCLVWQLTTSEPPLARVPPQQRAWATVPVFTPAHPVPEALEAWLRRCLHPDPAHRFRFAADARHALERLGEAPEGPVRVPTAPAPDSTGTTWAEPTLLDGVDSDAPTLAATPAPVTRRRVQGGRLAELVAPPVPSAPADRPSRPLPRGAGLGLVGLRPLPLVGRDAIQRRCWALLDQVRRTGRPAVLVLRGPIGAGASRLARWLLTHAHATGAATALEAVEDPGATGGVARVVRAALRTHGLADVEVVDRTEALLRGLGATDPWEWHALTTVQHPECDRVRFGSEGARHATVTALLRRLVNADLAGGGPRPWIVLLDDAHRDADSLAWAAALTRAVGPAPILAVLTTQPGTPVEGPGVEEIDLPPLDGPATAALVRGLLGLDGALAARLEERSGGNPAFAVRVVGDWVRRGLLAQGPHGFELTGDEPALPEDLYALWNRQIGSVLATRSRLERVALQVAAVLGLEVRAAVWRSACLAARVSPSPSLIEDLFDAQLARPLADDDGFVFAHPMVRETLIRLAHDSGGLRDRHRACVAALRTDPDAGPLRLGRHLIAGGYEPAGIDCLLEAASLLERQGSPRRALAILEEADAAMPRQPSTAPVVSHVLRARCHLASGRLPASLKAAERAVDLALDLEDRALEARARLALAQATTDPAEREAMALEAEDLFDEVGDPHGVVKVRLARGRAAALDGDVRTARTLLRSTTGRLHVGQDPVGAAQAAGILGLAELHAGRLDDAEEALRHAHDLAAGAGYLAGRAAWATGLGSVALRRGDLDQAERHHQEAHDLYSRIEDREGLAVAIANLATLHRARGDLARAEQAQRAAVALAEEVDGAQAFVPRLDLALTLLDGNQLAEARQVLAAVPDLRAAGHIGWAGVAAALRLCLAIGDAPAWDHHLAEARSCLHTSAFADPDLLRMLERAAAQAQAWDPERAAQAAALARTQADRLGDAEALQRLTPDP